MNLRGSRSIRLKHEMKSQDSYNVIFQLSNNDTFVQKSLLRQISSLVDTLKDVRIEVVTHSFGIDLLLRDSPFQGKVAELQEKGVEFLVCENTVRSDKLRQQDFDNVRIVPAGIAHIIKRQSEGWAYIKAGY